MSYPFFSKSAAARQQILLLACFPAIASAVNLRIVTYNTQGDVSTPAPANVPAQIATVLEGIGQEKYTGDNILQLPDIVALQETTSNSTSVAPLVGDLNSYYGSSIYSYSTYQATQYGSATVGNGPNALIYNQNTIHLMASAGVGTPGGANNGEFRQVVRYELQPLADAGTNNGVFYVYCCHAKSLADGVIATDQTEQQEEATIIRNDEAANLPANAAVLYMGDWNVDADTDPSMVEMTSSGQGQAIDALNPGNQSENWAKNSTYLTYLSDSVATLNYRDDFQLMTSNVLNGSAGSITYIGNSEHPFANNGSTAVGKNINLGSNTALADMVNNGPLTSSQVLTAMNKSTGSDHLPVVADYSIAIGPNGIWAGGNANWSNASYWSNAVVPNSSTLEVKIDNSNAINSIVTLDQAASAADLLLDAGDTLQVNAGSVLTLAGPAVTVLSGVLSNSGTISFASASVGPAGSFTLAASGSLKVAGAFTNQGTATFGGSQNWSAGSIFNNGGGAAVFNTDAGALAATLTINAMAGATTLASTQHLAGLNISSGATVTLTSSTSRSVLVTSTLTDAGTLNLTNGALDVSGSSLSAITALIKQGFNSASGGNWNGSGITSSTAAGDSTHLTALGVLQNNQSGSALFTPAHPFDGVTPGAGDVLVEYTYFGDATLDGQVDGSDYGRIDNGYLTGATGWFNGDFNYDGAVDGSDYTLIDNAFNTQGAQLSTQLADPTASITSQITGVAAVPEPGSFLGLGVTTVAILRRRRRSALPA